MPDYCITDDHPFFREALQFAAVYVTRAGMLFKSFSEIETLSIADGNLIIALMRVRALAEFLSGTGDAPTKIEFRLRYNFRAMLIDPEPEEPTPKALPVGHLGPRLCVYLLGFAQESQKKRLVSALGKDHTRWPAELQLFHHIRNGCFHDNLFDIYPEKFDAACPAHWAPSIGDELRIDDIESVNGRKVVGDFMRVPHVLPMLHDMGVFIRDLPQRKI